MRLGRKTTLAAVAAAGALALAGCSESADNSDDQAQTPSDVECASGTLSAEGSSAQNNAMSEWIKGYQTACPDATINYNPTGSGAGIQQFVAGQVDFAGSDAAIEGKDAEAAAKTCENNDAWNLPMVVGPVAIAFNLGDLKDLVLDADTAAQIFSGDITKWNDDAIAALNSGADLPAEDIIVFFRSDESGTTDNFTRYLSAAAPQQWTKEPGKAWTGVGEGKPGSAGVQQGVSQNEYSISYMEMSFATDIGLGTASIDTGSGDPVELTTDTASAALESAESTGSGNSIVLEIDYATDAPGAYPIVLVTYEVVCSAGQPQEITDLVRSFLNYTSTTGQESLTDIGYAPLPDSLQADVSSAIAAIS